MPRAWCDPAKKLVRLSAKTELLGSPLHASRLRRRDGRRRSHGVVIAVREAGVAFLGGVVGRVRGSKIRATLGAVWEASFRATARGRWSLPRRPLRRTAAALVLSFLTADQAAALPPSAAALPAGAKPAGAALSLRVGTTVDDGATSPPPPPTAFGSLSAIRRTAGCIPLTDSAAAAPA